MTILGVRKIRSVPVIAILDDPRQRDTKRSAARKTYPINDVSNSYQGLKRIKCMITLFPPQKEKCSTSPDYEATASPSPTMDQPQKTHLSQAPSAYQDTRSSKTSSSHSTPTSQSAPTPCEETSQLQSPSPSIYRYMYNPLCCVFRGTSTVC